VSDTRLHDLTTERPSVTFRDAEGRSERVEADVVVGCEGALGRRGALPEASRQVWSAPALTPG
jgi:p-hydroxybenzoate 3-monooxygenase